LEIAFVTVDAQAVDAEGLDRGLHFFGAAREFQQRVGRGVVAVEQHVIEKLTRGEDRRLVAQAIGQRRAAGRDVGRGQAQFGVEALVALLDHAQESDCNGQFANALHREQFAAAHEGRAALGDIDGGEADAREARFIGEACDLGLKRRVGRAERCHVLRDGRQSVGTRDARAKGERRGADEEVSSDECRIQGFALSG
jgi:hypothetical protein